MLHLILQNDFVKYIQNQKTSNESLTHRIDGTNKNLYRNIYWMNFHEFFIPTLTIDNKSQRFEDQFSPYENKWFKVNNDFSIEDTNVKKDPYLKNLVDNYLNIKIYDSAENNYHDEMDKEGIDINSVTYSEMSLDFKKLSDKIRETRGDLSLEEIKNMVFNGANSVNIVGVFDLFESLQTIILDKVLEFADSPEGQRLVKPLDKIKKTITVKNVKGDVKFNTLNFDTKNKKNKKELLIMLAAMFNDDSNIGGGKGIFCSDDLEKICDDAIEQLKKDKNQNVKDYFTKMLSGEDKDETELKRESFFRKLYLAPVFLMINKYINQNNISFTQKGLDYVRSLKLNPKEDALLVGIFKNELQKSKIKFSDPKKIDEIVKKPNELFIKDNVLTNLPYAYVTKNDLGKKVKSNIVTYKRRDPVAAKYAWLYIVIFSAALIGIGLEVFVKKNFG